jgi:hypothetical protein
MSYKIVAFALMNHISNDCQINVPYVWDLINYDFFIIPLQ